MTSDVVVARWPLFAALGALSLLAIAHAFETFGGYPPCELCLKQRDVYWAVVWSGLVLTGLIRLKPSLAVVAGALITALLLLEAGVAAFHAGVEWKFWPGPLSCTSAGVRPVGVADMQALLSGKPQRIIQCDVAAWRLFGLSMAGWNCLCALALSAVGAYVLYLGLRKADRP